MSRTTIIPPPPDAPVVVELPPTDRIAAGRSRLVREERATLRPVPAPLVARRVKGVAP